MRKTAVAIVLFLVLLGLVCWLVGCQFTTKVEYVHPQRGKSTWKTDVQLVPRLEWTDGPALPVAEIEKTRPAKAEGAT